MENEGMHPSEILDVDLNQIKKKKILSKEQSLLIVIQFPEKSVPSK